MSNGEVVSIVLSVIAILATLLNIVLYYHMTKEYNGLVKEQNRISQEQNKISQGQAETSLRDLIMQARRHVEEIAEKSIVFDLNSSDKDGKNVIDKQIIDSMFKSAQEDLRNAYEEACSRYLDEKVDKVRFKRMYFTEIRQLVEDKEQNEYYDNISSRYECTVKVYTEWCKLEK